MTKVFRFPGAVVENRARTFVATTPLAVRSELSPAKRRNVMHTPRILYLISEDWFFCSHFMDRAAAALSEGYEVSVVTRVTDHGAEIKSRGFKLIPVDLDRRCAKPWIELQLIRRLIEVYRSERPDVVHHIALKPILYGTIAAKMAGIGNIINAPVGMGFAVSSRTWRASLVRPFILSAYRLLMNPRKSLVIVENPDDGAMLVRRRIADAGRVRLIRGAGVDLGSFVPSAEQAGPPVVVLPARMLWEKGVREFVEAAQLLRAKGISARFALVGGTDAGSPGAISYALLSSWVARGNVEWWGHRMDMPEVLRACHIVCLPSYREGLPKALIEAAASARPIVTTDVPGCREVVKHRENGFLVPPRDIVALAQALELLVEDPALRQRMGARGREMAQEAFSTGKVVADTLAVYRELLVQP